MLALKLCSLEGKEDLLVSYDNEDISSLEQLPILMVLPYGQLSSYYMDNSILVGRLRNYRFERKKTLEKETPSVGFLEDNEDDEIGILDLWDIDFLKNNALLMAPCSSTMAQIRQWLEQFLALQPAQSAIGESWFLWLSEKVNAAGKDAYFSLDLAELFAVGQVFETTLWRCKISYNFLYRLEDASSIVAMVSPNEQVQQMITHMLRDLQKPANWYNNETIEFLDPFINDIHKLRLDVLHGYWDEFKSKVDPKNSSHFLLIKPAYLVAKMMQQETEETTLELDRNRLWLKSNQPEFFERVLNDQISLAYDWRQNERYEEAKDLLELTQSQIQPLLAEYEELLKDYIRLLNNLAYLYIIPLKTSRKAFDMLLPIVQEFDVQPKKWQSVNAKDRARVRANFEASIFYLHQGGEDIPPLANMQYLSTQEGKWTDEQGCLMNQAIQEKRPNDALKICNEVLEMLQTKGFLPTNSNVITWKIDQARSLRDLGKMNEAVTQLCEVIDTIEQVEQMHVKSELLRAMIALAITYERMGLRDESKGIYKELVSNPLRDETAKGIATSMRQAHYNLALMLNKDGEFEEASQQYQQAFWYSKKLGLEEEGSNMLWRAYLSAKQAQLLQLQYDSLTLLCTTYQDSIDPSVNQRVKEARYILNIMDKKQTSIKEKILKFLGCKESFKSTQ